MRGFVQTCDTSYQFMELGGFASRFWSRKSLVQLFSMVWLAMQAGGSPNSKMLAREDGNLEQHPQVPSN